MPPTLPPDEIAALRKQHYNTTVTGLRLVHDELMVLRVQPDGGMPEFRSGQYTTLGLGYWEPRAPDTQAEHLDEKELRKVVKRAYSISFPVLDESGKLLTHADCDYLEFYLVLVRESPGAPPALTPRLFSLKLKDRLFVGTKITGHYTLAHVTENQHVVFFATGTGEAPHNAMIAELLARHHKGKIINAICVRQKTDLAYLETHRQLERQFPNYRYWTLTTREPENIDRTHAGYVGKQYLQSLIESGRLESELGGSIDPQRTHVFLCGNPAMIGIPQAADDGARTYPQPTGVIELLERRGFHADERGQTGNVHFEKYW
ncbi:MAG: ferredoxin--NADP reductase [Planctomycetaceae bacterium]